MITQLRQERERERRRQQIIAASKRAIAAKGFSKTTIKDIAHEAELSPGTLYIYFKNKDELYASLSIRMLKHLIVRLQRVKEMQANDPAQRIDAVKKALCEVYDIDPPMLINLFHLQSSETLENISAELLDQITELTRQSLLTLADIFETGIEEGLFRARDPMQIALAVWAMFSGLILWEESKRTLDRHKEFLMSTLDLGFAIFSRGITKQTDG